MIKILNSINLHNTLEIPEDNKIYIEGYCCHFNQVNMNGEMVRPGAFDEFFKLLQDKKNMPMMNAFHKSDLIIGVWTDIRQDENGLWVEGYVDLNIKQVADNLAPLIRTGGLNNLSTEGWVSYNDIEEAEDHYIVNKMILTGISLVPIGADMDTKFTIQETPKSDENHNEPNENPTEPVENQLDPKNQNKNEKSVSKQLLFYI